VSRESKYRCCTWIGNDSPSRWPIQQHSRRRGRAGLLPGRSPVSLLHVKQPDGLGGQAGWQGRQPRRDAGACEAGAPSRECRRRPVRPPVASPPVASRPAPALRPGRPAPGRAIPGPPCTRRRGRAGGARASPAPPDRPPPIATRQLRSPAPHAPVDADGINRWRRARGTSGSAGTPGRRVVVAPSPARTRPTVGSLGSSLGRPRLSHLFRRSNPPHEFR
jgi:hypothetical protein